MPLKDKEARRAYQRRYREAHSERLNERSKAYNKANAERIKVYREGYLEAHSKFIKTRQKEYYQANVECRKAYSAAYRQTNPERVKESQKAYYTANKDRLGQYKKGWNQANTSHRKAQHKAWREANVGYLKEYFEANPDRKLANRYRNMIRQKLKDQDARKSAKTIVLLDCDIPCLVAWIEVQFRPGMSWENYGPVWHVDHKRPCASFDLSDPVQQHRCFHWTNLQPLFAQENLSKGSKWEISEEIG